MSSFFKKNHASNDSESALFAPPNEIRSMEGEIVYSCNSEGSFEFYSSFLMAQLMDESGFATNILNSSEEDCWNDL